MASKRGSSVSYGEPDSSVSDMAGSVCLPSPAMALRFVATSSAESPASDLLDALHDEYDAAAGRALVGGPSAEPSDFTPPTGAFLLAYDDDRAIACGGLKTVDVGVAEVKRMYVVPAARRRGVGRALLAALEAQARRWASRASASTASGTTGRSTALRATPRSATTTTTRSPITGPRST